MQELNHCFNIPLNSETKYCTLNENNECVEQYKLCSDYKGNDKNICESNIAYDLSKCSFDNGKCDVMEQVECSYYKRFLEKDDCESNNDYLGNKKCVYSNYQCVLLLNSNLFHLMLSSSSSFYVLFLVVFFHTISSKEILQQIQTWFWCLWNFVSIYEHITVSTDTSVSY